MNIKYIHHICPLSPFSYFLLPPTAPVLNQYLLSFPALQVLSVYL
jgi:hypothetical protein